MLGEIDNNFVRPDAATIAILAVVCVYYHNGLVNVSWK